jgi:hypothetical protein
MPLMRTGSRTGESWVMWDITTKPFGATMRWLASASCMSQESMLCVTSANMHRC